MAGSRYSEAMLVPHARLSPAALQAVIAEFVTRDGTDHTAIEPRIESIRTQLESGRIELHYDVETASCRFMPRA